MQIALDPREPHPVLRGLPHLAPVAQGSFVGGLHEVVCIPLVWQKPARIGRDLLLEIRASQPEELLCFHAGSPADKTSGWLESFHPFLWPLEKFGGKARVGLRRETLRGLGLAFADLNSVMQRDATAPGAWAIGFGWLAAAGCPAGVGRRPVIWAASDWSLESRGGERS